MSFVFLATAYKVMLKSSIATNQVFISLQPKVA